ncbi:MAG TPA: DNA glycosylase [Clostridiales bacterium]|jgi:N-glycosylase/DNA lyase|nr:DNA glycosylase [Clostridiales bacterium]HRT81953.1 DNA glycosylase [Oscillospiraceae bacterium]
MQVKEENGNLTAHNLKCFDLGLTLDCGQAFRWRQVDQNCWRGVAFGKALTVCQNSDTLILNDTNREDFESIWRTYFDLDRDYEALCKSFSQDENLKAAVEAYPGIRLLRQEPWEALCSFIISQNNNIPRIKGIIDRLCANFGEHLGENDYSFPSPQSLASLSVEDLAPLRAGFRAKYIIDAAQKVASGEVALENLKDADSDLARQELMKIKGVGPKVADCALLYGLGHIDIFPVDVWVKRILQEDYPQGFPKAANGARGIAQQYLFHWKRSGAGSAPQSSSKQLEITAKQWQSDSKAIAKQ